MRYFASRDRTRRVIFADHEASFKSGLYSTDDEIEAQALATTEGVTEITAAEARERREKKAGRKKAKAEKAPSEPKPAAEPPAEPPVEAPAGQEEGE